MSKILNEVEFLIMTKPVDTNAGMTAHANKYIKLGLQIDIPELKDLLYAIGELYYSKHKVTYAGSSIWKSSIGSLKECNTLILNYKQDVMSVINRLKCENEPEWMAIAKANGWGPLNK